MRRHGWELPYHPLQVVAIAVFLALAFAFYVFMAPFVGSRFMELISFAMYSPLMVSVFGLYIWCAASNPADPAIFLPKKNLGSCTSRTTTSIRTSGRVAGEKNETSVEPSSLAQPSCVQSKSSKGLTAGGEADEDGKKVVCRILPESLWFCRDSTCDSHQNEAYSEEDKLYCSLCEVQIYKQSKHCRVCDKCIDCFDHHCRWLNNCIGRKNYRIFIALMIFGVCLLVLEWVIGVWVIARCFLNRTQFQEEISSRLGSSFSLVAYLCVVVLSTLLAAFATLPLGQLCLFHALLIQKGMTTYDYIIAMREREQHHLGVLGERVLSPYASPASSVATAMSGASSAGALHHASWCTPPHFFVDHELAPIKVDEAKPISLETLKRPNVDNKIKKQAPAKISPWTLARLNPEDALRAAAEARKHSSVLRPVIRKDPIAVVIAETDSSCDPSSDEVTKGTFIATSPTSLNGHSRPSIAMVQSKRQQAVVRPWHGETSKVPVMLGGDAQGFIERGGPSAEVDTALMPLQLQARNAFLRRSGGGSGDGGGVSQSSSSLSISTSTESNQGSPEVRPASSRRDLQQEHRVSRSSHPLIQRQHILHTMAGHLQSQSASCSLIYDDEDEDSGSLSVPSKHPFIVQLESSTSDGYEASGGESADDSDRCQYQQAMHGENGSPVANDAVLVLSQRGVPCVRRHYNHEG